MLNDLEIKQASGNKDIKELIISCYTSLSYIDYIIKNKYLRVEVIEKLTRFITIDSISTTNSEMIINPLKFLINFYLKSFELGISENFRIFADEKAENLMSIFSLVRNSIKSKDEDSKKREENSQIIFLISCFFITISIKSNVWDRINENHLIKPSCDYIKKFIYETFSLENFPDGTIQVEKPAKSAEELKLEEQERKNYLKTRFGLIKLLANILGFIAKESVYKKIYHIEFFKYIFKFVVDLFHINFSDINSDIYSIFIVCSYFTDCKLLFYLEKENNFKTLLNDLFTRIKLTLSDYSRVKENYIKNKMITNTTRSTQDEMENKHIKTANDEKIKMFDNINNKRKIFAKTNFDEFTKLMYILCNLLMMNDFSVFKKLLFSDPDFDLELFKSDLAIFIEDFEKKSNIEHRIVSFDKYVHPAKLFLMIIDPMITFTSKIFFFKVFVLHK